MLIFIALNPARFRACVFFIIYHKNSKIGTFYTDSYVNAMRKQRERESISDCFSGATITVKNHHYYININWAAEYDGNLAIKIEVQNRMTMVTELQNMLLMEVKM